MDALMERLTTTDIEIKNLNKRKVQLKRKVRQNNISEEEEYELSEVEELLQELKDSKKDYLELIKLAIKNEPPESKSFSDADSEWIEAVTGVNTAYRKWAEFVIDTNIHPRPQFKKAFEDVGKAFHQHNEAGRRIYLNLFLSDIVLRPEFDGALRIFPELELEVVETNGPKRRKLHGRTDYTVGFAKEKDMFDNAIPRELHLVAVEAKTSIGEKDLWQCVAEAASLYKTRLDAGKRSKCVWGILSNAEMWKFIFIDENGQLSRSAACLIDLRSYNDTEVLHVYRIIHYIVKCCYQTCTPPPSTASSVGSVNQ